MADNIQIATYSGGSLGVYGAREKNGEAILALPLSRLIVKMVRIPNNVEASAAPPCWWALRQPCSSQPGCSPVIQKPEP